MEKPSVAESNELICSLLRGDMRSDLTVLAGAIETIALLSPKRERDIQDLINQATDKMQRLYRRWD